MPATPAMPDVPHVSTVSTVPGTSTRPSSTRTRPRAVPAMLGLATMVGASLTMPGTASAADAYRFWNYYSFAGGSWTFATEGAGTLVPADGSIDGWRFAISDMASTRAPRVQVTFDELCGTTAATAGTKRVGVVIDYGRPVDGPEGATPPSGAVLRCAQVPEQATGAQVLAAVARVRSNPQGLVCGIEGYPASGCMEKVSTVPAGATEPDDQLIAAGAPAPGASGTTVTGQPSQSAPSSTSAPAEETSSSAAPWLAGGLLALAAAALAGFLTRRRRKSERRPDETHPAVPPRR